MKNILFSFLLVIFCTQGFVAAFGSEIVASGHGQEKNICSVSALSEDAAEELEGLKVHPTIEELSDYVPFNLPVPMERHRGVITALLPAPLPSIDLPQLKPPPRQ